MGSSKRIAEARFHDAMVPKQSLEVKRRGLLKRSTAKKLDFLNRPAPGVSPQLPDAIIWATARQNDALLATRNTKNFPRNDPAMRIPYQL